MEELMTELLDDRILRVETFNANWRRLWLCQKFFNWNDAIEWLEHHYGVISVNRDLKGGFVMQFQDQESRMAFALTWDF
jgi:hypothetical protein